MSHEQLESQLSAMYDGELPAAECELLSRRLAREELLRARWSRYAMIGAVMRSEPVAAVSGDFARRVSNVIAADASRFSVRRLATNWWKPASGAALAAGVAGIAILVLRSGLPVQSPTVAAVRPAVAPASAAQPLTTVRPDSGYALATPTSREPASYVVPPRSSGTDVDVPASLASFVVAHSEYSPPLVRRHLLSAWIGNDLVQTTPPSSSVLFNDAGAAPPANGSN
ncbi:MAG TPA: sigma-E factor negative regulatory protein [Steroidobacteraceae bacterium]